MRFAGAEGPDGLRQRASKPPIEDGDQGFFLTEAQDHDAIKEENESDNE